MRILMIAPEPFFHPRGTSFSVFHRIKAMVSLGHTVDLLTYHLGEPVAMPGLRVIRTPNLPGIRHVKIGFSWKKLPLWITLFVMTIARLRASHYDVMHTHEDAVFIGALLTRWFKIPHIYDMHSSLPQQFQNYHVPILSHFVGLFAWTERFALSRSDGIIAICPALVEHVASIRPKANVMLIENVALTLETQPPSAEQLAEKRRELKLEGATVVLYTGTLEKNQGLDFLLRVLKAALVQVPELKLVLVGGEQHQIAEFRELADSLGLADAVTFTGRRPVEEMNLYMGLADILVSPRSIGTNTPLKIYSYMQSGKAILATNLKTHSQVLSSNEALLAPYEEQAFAEALVRLARDEGLRLRLGAAAQQLLAERYGYQRFLALNQTLLLSVASPKNGIDDDKC